MPNLDVSDLLFDPDLADRFDVERVAETVGSNGRTTLQRTLHPKIVGVLTPESPADLIRRDDAQMMTHKLSVVTMFRLRGPSIGVQPDEILYHGARYTVVSVMPFSRFGKGFVEATATAMASSAPPPV